MAKLNLNTQNSYNVITLQSIITLNQSGKESHMHTELHLLLLLIILLIRK